MARTSLNCYSAEFKESAYHICRQGHHEEALCNELVIIPNYSLRPKVLSPESFYPYKCFGT